MRKVIKNFDSIPVPLLSDACQQLIVVSLLEKGAHDFKTAIYGHEEVRIALGLIYFSKCAFCETDTSAGATLQVEHYRPKAKVTGANMHPGYYWLGYQWSNLLLACSSCNNKKRNRFPVNADRTTVPPLNDAGYLDIHRCRIDSIELTAEVPQLVNPEVDPDPMQHFRFQATGEIEYKTEVGKATIETCNLNRGRLIVWRKKVYDIVLNKFIRNFDRFHRGVLSEDHLKSRLLAIIEDDLIDYINDDTNQYLEYAKTCWREFENFFIARFQPAERQYLKAVYDDLVAAMDNA